MRRNNRIEIIGGECVINSRARRVPCVCSRGYVSRIVRIADSLFRLFEDLLTVINQFLLAMRVVESNQVSQTFACLCA